MTGRDVTAFTPRDPVHAGPVEDERHTDDIEPSQLTREFLVFEGKVLLNSLSDLALAPLAAVAFAMDLITSRGKSARWFHGLLRLGRRWDRWLRLFRPIRSSQALESEGLAAAGVRGADHLVAHVESLVRAGELPEPLRRRLDALTRSGDAAPAPTDGSGRGGSQDG